jgi:hypothetical protein
VAELAPFALTPSFADDYAVMGGVNTYVGRPANTVGVVAYRNAPQPPRRAIFTFYCSEAKQRAQEKKINVKRYEPA